MHAYQPIHLAEAFSRFTDQWSPKIIAALNDYHLKAVRIEGAFVWHAHADTDECFFVVDGEMRIEFRDGDVKLEAGDLYVVPRGIEHRPVAENECHVLVIEPSTTVNTGDAGGPMTVDAPEWLEHP